VTSTSTFDGNNVLIAKTETGYDQLALLASPPGAVPVRHDPAYGLSYTTRGLPTVVNKWYDIANDLYVSTSAQYDEFGNPRIVTNPRNHSATTNYWSTSADNALAFPVEVTPIRKGPRTIGHSISNATESLERPTDVTTLLGNENRFCGPESSFKERLF